jgi:predicted dienelactone hydrolase
MRVLFLILTCLLSLMAQTTAAYRPVDGPFTIGAATGVVLHDPGRHKDLRIRVQYPEAAGRFPVILFSHGAGGSKDGYTGLTGFWAKHGYITIQPTHADSLSLRGGGSLTEAQRLAAAAAVPELDDPSAWADRVRDLTFILDSFDEIASQVPQLAARADLTKVGAGGHSFGACTTMLLGGAAVDIPNGPTGKSFADGRPRALLVISGQGKGRFGFTDRSWSTLTRPMMVMTGSKDLGYKGQSPDWRREPYRFSPSGDKYEVFIEGATHMTFSGRPSEAGQEPESLFEYAKLSSLAFWDAYLKQSSAARVWLAADSLKRSSEGVATVSHK